MRARIWIALAAGCLLRLFSLAQGAGAATLQPVGTFNTPIYVTSPPGDPRLFVVERGGTIEVVHDGVQSQFLDIHDLTTRTASAVCSRWPSTPTTPRTASSTSSTRAPRPPMARAGSSTSTSSTSARIPTSPIRASRRPVLTISPERRASNHNGGQLQFGKDGQLYISVGDGGTGGSNAPNLGLLNGKILRIDPHGATQGAYSIPAGNPYATSGSARHEIWASGSATRGGSRSTPPPGI